MYDSNYLNFVEYVWMLLIVFICSWLFITCSCITLVLILNPHEKYEKYVCLINLSNP